MTDGKRNLSPMQFGLLGLFVLTFFAAIAAAIFRLPFLLPIRLLLILTLWCVFQVVVMNMTGHGPTRRFRMVVMNSVGLVIQFIPLCTDILIHRSKMPLWFIAIFALALFGMLAFTAAQIVWAVRSALKPEKEQP